MHPIQYLERYWKFTSFRPLQEDIIKAVMDNEDTFALLPTGGGKTLCFQIPALAKEGICIVISPLIALIQDQVTQLKRKGIKAIALSSGLSKKDLDILLDNAIYGNFKFLYLSPERLAQPLVKERIQQMKVSLIAIDEAHCISQWGYDFRPAYLHIKDLRQWHPHVSCIALTATAKPEIIEDITRHLDFINPKVFKGSYKRENLAFMVRHCEDKWYELCKHLESSLSSSIVYVRTRRDCKLISQRLHRNGFSSNYYHGGLSSDEKKTRLKNWLDNKTAIMVATTAFGMGIDKSDVDTVIHFSLPESIEAYYQEAGRAGRNGLPAKAVLLIKSQDEALLKKQFIDSLPSVADIKYVYKKLCNYFQIAYGEGDLEVFQINFKDFCNTYNLNSISTYNALLVLDRNSIISMTKNFNFRTKIQFKVTNHQLFDYLDRHPSYDIPVKILLRTYGGIFDYLTKVDLDLMMKKSQLKEATLISILKTLEQDQMIDLHLAESDAEITFLKAREDDRTINPLITIIESQHSKKIEQINSVMQYVNNSKECLQKQILNYFGESNSEDCGICSVCNNQTASKELKFEEILLQLEPLLKSKALNSRELCKLLEIEETQVFKSLKILLEEGLITITKSNKYLWTDQ